MLQLLYQPYKLEIKMEMYLRVALKSNPDTVVWVRTRQDRQATKRRSIQADIAYQRFPRWAPFAGLSFGRDYTISAWHLDQTTEYLLCHGSHNGRMIQE